ncbi:MAG: PhnE/PtxC family ABC transporter permease [Planctomycetota bacterium]|jgi:phosphonate transport system permease protein
MRRTVLALIAAAGLASAWYLELTPAGLWPGEGGFTVMRKFFARAFAPALYSEGGTGVFLVPQALEGARLTVVFAAAGMSLSLVCGLLLGFLASSAWWTGDPAGGGHPVTVFLRRTVAPVVYTAARVGIALMRSVHELLWALLFLCAFGLSNANAVFAIAIPYSGTLAKIFSEMIDEAPRDAAEALRATGASPLQVFCFGLLPRALPDMAAYAFYRFECALRASAVLGFFGLPTLGYYIKLSFDNLYYGEVWTYLYALFLLVVLVDWWSGALRRRVLMA